MLGTAKSGTVLLTRCVYHQHIAQATLGPSASSQVRNVSTSPYGRTHVWKRRAPKLPNPVVPKFPQLVIRSDGTSFVHWTTSPRSIIRLTRDTTNHPMWNTGVWIDERSAQDEGAATGRLGRFNRRFEALGGARGGAGGDWMDTMVEAQREGGSSQQEKKKEKPKPEEAGKSKGVEKSKAEKSKAEKPKEGEKSKAGKPKEGEKPKAKAGKK